MSDTKKPCRYVLVALDETADWILRNLETVKEGARAPDRIIGIWLCSPDIGVHLCELTPSTELRRVETYAVWNEDGPDPDEDAVRVQEEVSTMQCGCYDSIDYMHRSSLLRRFPLLRVASDSNFVGIEPNDRQEGANPHEAWCLVGEIPQDEDEEEAYEDLFEDVCCNSRL